MRQAFRIFSLAVSEGHTDIKTHGLFQDRKERNMKITEDSIRQLAGSSSALSNGKKLCQSGKFEGLYQSPDKSLIFGTCKGSGKTPYHCSVDFSDEGNPIARCSCPSRQIPCKHAIGLLYCMEQGTPFVEQEIPDDVASKRAKRQARAEKKETSQPKAPAQMTKAKASVAAKKCRVQREGLEQAGKMLQNILTAGLHSLDAQSSRLMATQVKELGNHYIPGVQAAFSDLLLLAAQAQKGQNYVPVIEQTNYIHALLQKGEEYLSCKQGDFEAFPQLGETAKQAMLHSPIEEQLGHAWKLSELNEAGLSRSEESLLQLSFRCMEDQGKAQWVDEGIWLSLTDGCLFRTFNYRPYRAAKYINAEDSVFGVQETKPLYLYPGEENPRVRWESAIHREATQQDRIQAIFFAKDDFLAVMKLVRNQIKNPLADKNPIHSLKVGTIHTGSDGWMSVLDERGTRILLRLKQFGHLLRRTNGPQVAGGALICRFEQDMRSNLLYAVPLALVTDGAVLRFYY